MKKMKHVPSVFISYAFKDKAISEKLAKKLQEIGINVVTDEQILSYKGSIYDFMNKKIDNAKYIIVVISESYLKSKHCMFEFNEISRNREFSTKCFPLIVKDANLFSQKTRKDCSFFWDKEIDKIEKEIKWKDENSDESNRLLYDLNICSNNKNKIYHLFDYLTHMYTFEIDENAEEIINILTNALQTKCKIDAQKEIVDNSKALEDE